MTILSNQGRPQPNERCSHEKIELMKKAATETLTLLDTLDKLKDYSDRGPMFRETSYSIQSDIEDLLTWHLCDVVPDHPRCKAEA